MILIVTVKDAKIVSSNSLLWLYNLVYLTRSDALNRHCLFTNVKEGITQLTFSLVGCSGFAFASFLLVLGVFLKRSPILLLVVLGLVRLDASRRPSSRGHLASRSLRPIRCASSTHAVLVAFFREHGLALLGCRPFTSCDETPASFVARSLVTSGVAMTFRPLFLVVLATSNNSLL